MTPQGQSRADMHCHSTASQLSKLGVQRALGLPECATPPDEVHRLAKARGMDFVTITDHDTIDGALELAALPGVFVSEELTAWFRGEPQAVHVLCYGITPDDHEWLQGRAKDVEVVSELATTFVPGDAVGVGAAIAAARRAPRDERAASSLARRSGRDAVFAAELASLRAVGR